MESRDKFLSIYEVRDQQFAFPQITLEVPYDTQNTIFDFNFDNIIKFNVLPEISPKKYAQFAYRN